ncbi:hypothetical protein ABZ234_08255 [Nocardiopsis sp. NPDC006198]|uniref:DUF7167 family protein n=1 Tax=Nocardiopsis sp. NPDC006198 TaxID=3154472 RepID=UPI0033A046D9
MSVVRVELIVEHDTAVTHTEITEIDRAEWDEMTPTEREKWCIEQAEEARANLCGSGFEVLDGVDIDA